MIHIDNQKFKNSSLHNKTEDGEVYKNNDEDSAIENNKNDLVSNQGNSGIVNGTANRKTKFEKAYIMRRERDYRDEENPMYDDSDQPFGAPDRF